MAARELIRTDRGHLRKPLTRTAYYLSQHGLYGGDNDPRVLRAKAVRDKLLEAPEQDLDPAVIQAAEDALREAIAARDLTREGKRRGGRKAGLSGGKNDPRPLEAQAVVEELFNAPEIDEDAIVAAKEAHKNAIEMQQKASKGKRKAGLSGGKNDPRPVEAQAVVEELLNAPEIDEVAIEAARKKHKNAIEMQQKASKGKSEGGKKRGKKTGKYIP
jgi:F0F1-type ATP synthase epsilon subunit